MSFTTYKVTIECRLCGAKAVTATFSNTESRSVKCKQCGCNHYCTWSYDTMTTVIFYSISFLNGVNTYKVLYYPQKQMTCIYKEVEIKSKNPCGEFLTNTVAVIDGIFPLEDIQKRIKTIEVFS